jgi:hypothetical protein
VFALRDIKIAASPEASRKGEIRARSGEVAGMLRQALPKSSYKALTQTPESKKPRIIPEAKCLIILVGCEWLEHSTYGLRVRCSTN